MKRVNFNMDNINIVETYSRNEYDRSQIDSILYMKCYNRISHEEWQKERESLNMFKYTEMIVHKKSIKYTQFN
jgi:hypothetical protein